MEALHDAIRKAEDVLHQAKIDNAVCEAYHTELVRVNKPRKPPKKRQLTEDERKAAFEKILGSTLV